MANAPRPPFRADIVGSFLRPEALKQARENYLGPQAPDTNLGPHDNADLRAVEDAPTSSSAGSTRQHGSCRSISSRSVRNAASPVRSRAIR